MQIFANKEFENPIQIIEAFDNESFIGAFSQIEDLRKCPYHYLLGYIRYEAKDVFSGKKIKSDLPLLYFELYKGEKEKGKREKRKEEKLNLSTYSLINLSTYNNAISQIKEEIAEGNTYQVNYTYDYEIETDMDGFDLYNSILHNQKTPYNAYIKNKYEEILCFSPELFFTLKGNNIRTKPMKGTVKRGVNEEEDKKNIEFLKNDIKNRAENVMIVDLLRNDLGKIAKTGSVKVDKLFEVETHKTVHQMTSEISAELEEDITLYEIFEALFPCGSVTGAPKVNTMEIIERLEVGKRGVYCGAIGLITPEETVFTVPIRTLQGVNGTYTCRVGGAIVWDSTPEDEWEETLTKIKFLGGNMNDFKIVETMLVANGEIQDKTAHIQRMKNSSAKLDFKFSEEKFNITFYSDCVLRALLSKDGTFETQILPVNELNTNRIVISEQKVNSQEPLLYHKTTYRPWYQEATEKIKQGLVFDEIFFNEKGELTEGARSNVVLQLEGKWFTPPVACGLLNGILRQKLVDEGKIEEKILYLEELGNAEKVFCINSVRGIVEVQLSCSSFPRPLGERVRVRGTS